MTMTNKKRKALTAAGWRVGDAADFLGLTAEEQQLVEMRLTVTENGAPVFTREWRERIPRDHL
jgi:hypothetical protein